MQCEVCGGKPCDGVDLYRVNAKGQPGRWRCIKHTTPVPELRQIVETISETPADVLAPPGFQWCPRTGILERIQ